MTHPLVSQIPVVQKKGRGEGGKDIETKAGKTSEY